jgi:hypothetical protein
MKRLAFAVLAGLVVGCSNNPVTPHYDVRFGDAVREARQRQTLNPQAGREGAALTGMDGVAARESVDRYHEAFKAPPPVVNVINIGNSVSGGSGGGR